MLLTIHFGRLQEYGPDRDRHRLHHTAADFLFDLARALPGCFPFVSAHYDDLFSSEIWIEDAQRNRSTVVDRGMDGNDLFNVLRINIFAADDQEILSSSHYRELIQVQESEMTRADTSYSRALGPSGYRGW